VNLGDPEALSLFLNLMNYAWGSAQADIEIEPKFRYLRNHLIGVVDNLTAASISVSHQDTVGSKSAPAMVARLVKIYSDFMKRSVDKVSAEDLTFTAKHLLDAFTSNIALHASIDNESESPSSLGILVNQLIAAALVGIDGWLLLLGGREPARSETSGLRSALEPFLLQINPWDALPWIVQYQASQHFGWTSWELFASEERHGIAITITTVIKSALIRSASARDMTPTLEQLQSSISEPDSPNDLRFLIEDLLRNVNSISERWFWSENYEVGLDRIRTVLQAFLENARVELSDELIRRELSHELVREFRETIRRQRSQLRLTDVFESIEYNQSLALELAKTDGFMRIGMNLLVSKDYFVESPVEAHPESLGGQFVRAQSIAEQTYVLGQLIAELPGQPSNRESAVHDVRREIERIRRQGGAPILLISGSWTLARLFDDDVERWTETLPSLLRRGDFRGTRAYWTVAVRNQNCIVFDSSNAGRLCWRRMTSEASEDLQEDGRLLVRVTQISEAGARELITSNSNFSVRDGVNLAEPEAIRRLREEVHVEVLEDVVWYRGTGSGIVFEMPSEEDFAG
jgi:hypothetical protein